MKITKKDLGKIIQETIDEVVKEGEGIHAPSPSPSRQPSRRDKKRTKQSGTTGEVDHSVDHGVDYEDPTDMTDYGKIKEEEEEYVELTDLQTHMKGMQDALSILKKSFLGPIGRDLTADDVEKLLEYKAEILKELETWEMLARYYWKDIVK